MGPFEVRALDDSPKHLLLTMKLRVGGSLPICVAMGQQCIYVARHYIAMLYTKAISPFPAHFDVVIFLLTQCVQVTQLVSRFLLEGTVMYSGTFGVSVERQKFKSLLRYHLDWEPSVYSSFVLSLQRDFFPLHFYLTY